MQVCIIKHFDLPLFGKLILGNMPSEHEMEDSSGPVFRAPKRRKVLRRREGSPTEATGVSLAVLSPRATQTAAKPIAVQTSGTSGADLIEEGAAEEGDLSVAEIIRQRKLGKTTRRRGIEFNKVSERDGRGLAPADTPSNALVLAKEEVDIVQLVGNRFAPQTGTVAEVGDEHM